jgi:hypothetical protein
MKFNDTLFMAKEILRAMRWQEFDYNGDRLPGRSEILEPSGQSIVDDNLVR